MFNLSQLQVTVAAANDSGVVSFTDIDEIARYAMPGVIETNLVWSFQKVPDLPGYIGGVPSDTGFAEKGETNIGMICFPAHSAGKLDLHDAMGEGSLVVDANDSSMHKSNTVDIEIVISGKIDIVLESGETRTLVPGNCLVMGGVMHAWKNHYGDDCIVAIVVAGASGTVK